MRQSRPLTRTKNASAEIADQRELAQLD